MAYRHATRKDIEVGAKGEQAFAEFLQGKGIEFRKYCSMKNQAKLGDFRVRMKDGSIHSFEVKTRAHYSKDILIELWSNKKNRTKGWIQYLDRRTYVFYQFLDSDRAFTFRIGDMYDYLKNKYKKYERKRPHQYKDRHTEFICVPIGELLYHGICKKHKIERTNTEWQKEKVN